MLKTKKILLQEKTDSLIRYKIISEYLLDRIKEEDKPEERKQDLKECQKNIEELDKIIEYLKSV